jgi:hypothetical protein
LPFEHRSIKLLKHKTIKTKVELKGMKDEITGMERTQSGMRQDYSYNFLVFGSFAWR